MNIIEERLSLIFDRINSADVKTEVPEKFAEYCEKSFAFMKLMRESYEKIQEGFLQKASLDELRNMNHEIYEELLENNYETSYANPAYACDKLGLNMGRMLSFLYTELRAMIPFVYEGILEEMVIRMELFMEIYQSLVTAKEEGLETPDEKELRESLYWFVSDYSDSSAEWRVRTQVNPECDFATRIVMNSDLSDVRYLYQYGEYVSADTERLANFINHLPQEKVKLIADTYSEGYRIGFVKGNKDLSKKSVVDVRFIVGFERVVRVAVENFAKMGLKPTMCRACNTIFYKSGSRKNGYYGAIANKQFEYDHKDDIALFLDKKLVQRKLEVLRQAYEENKEYAGLYAGPAVIEEFGDVPFAPVAKPQACELTPEQQKLSTELTGASTGIVYEYIDGEQRSFTIIAFPVPQIGEKFEEIFDETIRINTLDYLSYEKMQAILIDTLNKAKYVEVKGMNGNKTDLHIELFDKAHIMV